MVNNRTGNPRISCDFSVNSTDQPQHIRRGVGSHHKMLGPPRLFSANPKTLFSANECSGVDRFCRSAGVEKMRLREPGSPRIKQNSARAGGAQSGTGFQPVKVGHASLPAPATPALSTSGKDARRTLTGGKPVLLCAYGAGSCICALCVRMRALSRAATLCTSSRTASA